jgi:hypothetical protein
MIAATISKPRNREIMQSRNLFGLLGNSGKSSLFEHRSPGVYPFVNPLFLLHFARFDTLSERLL